MQLKMRQKQLATTDYRTLLSGQVIKVWRIKGIGRKVGHREREDK